MRHSAYIIGFVVICGPFTGLMALNVNVKTRIEVKTHNEGESRAGVEGSRSPVYQGSRSRQNKASGDKQEVDCSHYTFDSCDTNGDGNEIKKSEKTRSAWSCSKTYCQKNEDAVCKTFLWFQPEKGIKEDNCWLYAKEKPSTLITKNCKVYGNTDGVSEGIDDDTLNVCMKQREELDCVRGMCDMSWLGDPIDTRSADDERDCKTFCKAAFDPECTYYEYNNHEKEKGCKMYNPREIPKSLQCTAVAAKKTVTKDELEICLKGKQGGDNNGTIPTTTPTPDTKVNVVHP